MITLAIIGICLYLYGWIKTLVVYVASFFTIVTAILASWVGVGGAMLFGWDQEVRLFQTGDFWVTEFVQREGFKLWEAFAVPIIAVGDIFRLMVKFIWQVPNPVSIIVFGYWLYLMWMMWWIVAQFFIKPKSDSTDVTIVE